MAEADWKPGGFTLALPSGRHMAVGWIKADFALDFRALTEWEDDVLPACWMLNHLPSGLAVMGLQRGLREAMEMGEAFAGLPIDWAAIVSAEDVARLPDASLAAMRTIRARYGDDAVHPNVTIGQWAFAGGSAQEMVQ